MKIKTIFYLHLLLSIIMFSNGYGQVKNSIYSMMGIGQLNNNSFGINRSLGGTGIAFKSGKSINYLNPASYLGIAKKSQIVEVGLYGIYSNSITSSKTQYESDINFDYLSLGFYSTPWWSFSLGITPFSYVDYKIKSEDQIEGELTQLEKIYEGSGGLNRLYFGNSFNLYGGLFVGFNLDYIVGPITKTETTEGLNGSAEYEVSHKYTASGLYLDYGLQYSLKVNSINYTFGAIYGAGKSLNTTDELEFTYGETVTALNQDNEENFYIPEKIGIGLALEIENNLRIGIDYEWNEWANTNFLNDYLNTKNSSRYSLGIEYTPLNRRMNNPWYNDLIYRIGANYQSSYLEIRNKNINAYALNLGLGIPYDNSSIINLTVEYGREGTTDNNLILNNYLKFYASFSIHEFWSASLGL